MPGLSLWSSRSWSWFKSIDAHNRANSRPKFLQSTTQVGSYSEPISNSVLWLQLMTTKSPPPANRGKTKSPTKDPPKQQSPAPIRLKTVVRRLPPNLPEVVFWQSVQPWVTDETASWKIFYQGKLRKKWVVLLYGVWFVRETWFRLNKENIPSRAYVLFKHEEQLAAFSREYDGHVFRDKQGMWIYPILTLRICDIAIRERVAGCGRVCTEPEGTSGEEESGF